MLINKSSKGGRARERERERDTEREREREREREKLPLKKIREKDNFFFTHV